MTQDDFFRRLDNLLVSSTTDPTITTPAQVIRSLGTPSASIAVLDAGNITTHCITNESTDPSTLFQACSISKPTAIICAFRLIQQKYFTLTSPIGPLLPPSLHAHFTRTRTSTTLLSTLTISHLMSHTAGLNVSYFPGYPSSVALPASTASLLASGPDANANTLALTISAFPGQAFTYSGGGTLLLQAIMEHVTQTPFTELMRKEIFEPLGMTRSFYHPLDEGEVNVAEAWHNGWTRCKEKWHVQPEGAAAGLWTTPQDLLRLIRGVQISLGELEARPQGSDGSGSGEKLLEYEMAKAMLTRTVDDIARGFFVDKKGTGFYHSGGNFPGWTCILVGWADLGWNRQPDEVAVGKEGSAQLPKGCGISIMTNSEMGLPVYYKLMHAIAYLKGWPEVPIEGDVKAPLRAAVSVSQGNEWRAWEGMWEDGWIIKEGEDGQPVAGMLASALIRIVPAAIPLREYEGGEKSIDLLLEDTEVMLRLGWEEEEAKSGGGTVERQRVVEVWNGLGRTKKALKRQGVKQA
jgi:CubicO group peptidase (beta-lactamase class C family)